MNQLVSITTALCLPAPDIEALIQGQTIAVLSRMFIRPGQKFAIYPTDSSTIPLSVERYYHSSFLPIAHTAFAKLNCQEFFLASEIISIKAWTKCELCQIINSAESLAALSSLTIWTQEALQEILKQRQNIFLAYLRVYQLLEPLEIAVQPQNRQFVPLPYSLTVSQAKPVLSDRTFAIRKHQLETLQPPLHPELEDLQSALASLAITNTAAKKLEQDIKAFLGWISEELIEQPNPNLAWINDIAALGDRSIKQDEGKSNYQAGTDFENIVRKSLEFLGFTVDDFHRGGAGGVDVFCSKPYPLVGECKAGKKIPNTTAVQLLNLGTLRLKSQELFKQAAKLIIGPGEPTTQLKDAAIIQGMSIINPETLEKLVKLQSKYPNSVDLFQLKEYLKVGQSDQEVEKYINKVNEDIKLRLQLVQAAKEISEQDNKSLKATSQSFTVTEIRAHYNATHNPKLTDETVRDFLIELSSPLTGYLGRIKGEDWKSDRFYFLRDLPTPKN
ncbi:DUF1802 domain-containing protein [Nostocales cyanobacterium HT-58-2]|nr:DUF1802 domain-containing protein [Nostocales cyanobacterium HT-58-2]